MRFWKLSLVAMITMLIVAMLGIPLTQGASPPPYTRLISNSTTGTVGNSLSQSPSISANGRWVAFASGASDLVANDTNALIDIFVYDRSTAGMTRVSVATDGTQATGGNSQNPSISSDGRYVVWESAATNLVANDTNALIDIFLHDRDTAITTRVNIGAGGAQAVGGDSIAPTLSTAANRIVYASAATNLVAGDTNTYQDIFMYTRATEATTRISVPNPPSTAQPNGRSLDPFITTNGNYVAFSSVSNNLVTGDDNDFCGTFSCADIFVRDLTNNTTTLVSRNTAGILGDRPSNEPAISDDGRYVVFESEADNLDSQINDTNFVADVFMRDRQTGSTIRVSKSASGEEGTFVSSDAFISADSNWIFFTTGSEFVASDTNFTPDVYRYQRSSGALNVVSLPDSGGEGDGASREGKSTNDGQRVVFWSEATNLVGNDTNNQPDVFIRTYLEDDATVTPTVSPTASGTATITPTPSNTPVPTMTPTITLTASATITPGGPPTLTPTGSPATRTPSPTSTRSGPPKVFLPLILRR